jgi:hypothetical protein
MIKTIGNKFPPNKCIPDIGAIILGQQQLPRSDLIFEKPKDEQGITVGTCGQLARSSEIHTDSIERPNVE